MTGEQALRYSRHMKLPHFGPEGQRKLQAARVLIIGVGGLGSPAALYLAAAGVGTIALMDGDKVSLSNLQRQILHFTPDLDKPKTLSATEKLHSLNPDVNIVGINRFLEADNAPQVIADYDFIIDATDSIEAKYLINDTCVEAAKPFSHGALLRYEGYTFTYLPGHATLRDIFGPQPAADEILTCSRAGVLGAAAGIIGTIQAAEAIKHITGIGQLLTDRLLTLDALSMTFSQIDIVH